MTPEEMKIKGVKPIALEKIVEQAGEERKTCGNCEGIVSDSFLFCPHCGMEFVEVEDATGLNEV